jgi:hypothetical protein
MTRKDDQQPPPADAQPSKEPAAEPAVCLYCGRPADDALGPLRREPAGWLLHFACSVQLNTQANEWRP